MFELTNHLSLVMDHHCKVLKDLIYIHDVGLQWEKNSNILKLKVAQHLLITSKYKKKCKHSKHLK